LARRAAKEAKDTPIQPALERPRVDIKKFVKIGRPGYRVTKQRDPESGQQSLMFEIDYPEVADGVAPRHRFMSAYEQKIEPPDRKWQYLLFAAEPYETIAFKVPSREVDKSETKFWSLWNKETKEFFLQFAFKLPQGEGRRGGGGGGPPPQFRGGMPPMPSGVGMVPPPPPNFAPVPPVNM
jgi:splicing factor 3A subunit 2